MSLFIKYVLILFALVFLLSFSVACSDTEPDDGFDPSLCEDPPELETVEYVSVEQYLGRWYEIASIPAWFQGYCIGGTTATYSLREDGDLDVLNECFSNSKLEAQTALAWLVDTNTNAKLKVNFLGTKSEATAGDYWIIDLDDNYQYAAVGYPDRSFGWILSRTPTMDQAVYNGIIDRLERQCYDINDFELTNQMDYPRE